MTQQELVETDLTGRWQEAVRNARSPGVSLSTLAYHLQNALRALNVRGCTVDVAHAWPSPHSVPQLEALLLENERSPHTFLIINHSQAVYVSDGAPCGHMSVIGAYDAASRRALVLDVDREYFDPYWLDTHTLLAGMQQRVRRLGTPRGYLTVRSQS